MPFVLNDLLRAKQAMEQYRRKAVSPHHERYSFPFFSGTYFAYRKVDVMRVISLAKSVAGADSASYLDVGCGYGDFLTRVREFLPDAEGLEIDSGIFYGLGREKPDYIKIGNASWLRGRYDIVFVGWMEPGQDYRDQVSKVTDLIVTTLDQGISLAAEFDGHGFQRVAWWRSPSWEDVNIEIMNRYYTPQLNSSDSNGQREKLSKSRGAHNLWYVYARPEKADLIRETLQKHIDTESPSQRYDFESVLDECGFGYFEKLTSYGEPLWKIQFD